MSDAVFRGSVTAADLFVHLVRSRPPTFKLGKATWETFEAQVGSVSIRAKRLTAAGLRILEGQDTRLSIAADSLRAEQLVLTGDGFELEVDEVELDSPRVKAGRELVCSQLRTRGISFRSDRSRPTPSDGPGIAPADWGFLDALQGHLNVDLFVDLTGPLVGRKRETHEFRIPIDGGSIDYEELEDDVRWLERSFLDIEVKGNRLILERDIASLPFTGKALIWWPLDEEELRLARKDRVRLRTLLGWQIPPKEAERRERKATLRFHNIEARKIDAQLSLQDVVNIDLGDAGRVSVARDPAAPPVLSLQGLLLHHRESESPPTQLSAEANHLTLETEELKIGASRLSAASIRLGELASVVVGFQGLRPSQLQGSLPSLDISKLKVRVPASTAWK